MFLFWAYMFLILAIVAAIFGFGAIVAVGIGIARVLFWVFVILFLISLIANWGSRGGRRSNY